MPPQAQVMHYHPARVSQGAFSTQVPPSARGMHHLGAQPHPQAAPRAPYPPYGNVHVNMDEATLAQHLDELRRQQTAKLAVLHGLQNDISKLNKLKAEKNMAMLRTKARLSKAKNNLSRIKKNGKTRSPLTTSINPMDATATPTAIVASSDATTPHTQDPAPPKTPVKNLDGIKAAQLAAEREFQSHMPTTDGFLSSLNAIPIPVQSSTPSASSSQQAHPSMPSAPVQVKRKHARSRRVHRRRLAAFSNGQVPTPALPQQQQQQPKNNDKGKVRAVYQSTMDDLGFSSMGAANDENTEKYDTICMYESNGGVCNDDTCKYTHFRDFGANVISDNE
ncbi:hypothetical protein BC940DRAFT_305266 [Gongronella butleri]|nr:hypothetical protein BC940DRAFT_305266 [Gongronella butleri]